MRVLDPLSFPNAAFMRGAYFERTPCGRVPASVNTLRGITLLVVSQGP